MGGEPPVEGHDTPLDDEERLKRGEGTQGRSAVSACEGLRRSRPVKEAPVGTPELHRGATFVLGYLEPAVGALTHPQT